MNIFITGATGYIGGAVAHRLRRAGHEVTALVRPSSDHAALSGAGIATITGDLADIDSVREAVQAHDVIVHAAMAHPDGETHDLHAIETLLGSRSQDAHFVYTSGVWLLARHEGTVDEETLPDPLPIVAWRVDHERRVLEAGTAAAPTTIIRPGCVYGGRQSLLRDWFSAIGRGDSIRVIGDGRNRWATIHIDDLAELYLKVIETRATGVLHATDDDGSTLTEMAEALARAAGRKATLIEFVPEAEARMQLGPVTDGYLADQRVSSRRTRERLGWVPKHGSFAASVGTQLEEWERQFETAGA